MEYRQRYLVSCQSLALHREVLGTSDLLDTRIPRVEKRFFSFLIATLCCWHKILLQCHFFCMLYFSMQSIFFLNFRASELMLQKLSKFDTACQYNHCKVNSSLSKHYLSWDRHCLPKFNINCSFAWDLYLIFTKVRSRSDVLPKIGQIPHIWISIFEQTWKIQTLESTLAMFGQKD